ncbi:MAG: ROK family protein [Candidatus Micrarchaeota archaeon]
MLNKIENKKERKIVGIDVGASKIEWAVFEKGRIEEKRGRDTPGNLDNAGIAKIIAQIAEENGAKKLGVALPGYVKEGRIIELPNLPNIKNLDIEGRLKRKLKIPVFAENDVKCAALAEWKERGGKRSDGFVMVAPGTGIGGAIVVNGKLVRGKENCAGEFGHMKMVFSQIRGKANAVEWEKICGGKGIENTFNRIIRGRGSLRSSMYNEESAKQILNSQNALAKRVSREAAYYFGIGIGNIANALNPGEFVVSGGVGKAYCGKYRKWMMDGFKESAIAPVRNMKISKSKIENPALAGAVLITGRRNDEEIGEFLG